jgi:hypothetical protein
MEDGESYHAQMRLLKISAGEDRGFFLHCRGSFLPISLKILPFCLLFLCWLPFSWNEAKEQLYQRKNSTEVVGREDGGIPDTIRPNFPKICTCAFPNLCVRITVK